MANVSSNASEFDTLTRVVIWTSLTLVIAVAAVNILVIGALIANAQLNRTVRFIIINLLLAGLAVAVASIIMHCYYAVVQEFPVDLQVFTPLCQAGSFLFLFGGAVRFLFTTLYATTVFVLVKFWNKPTIEPRNTKYFIVTAVIIWTVAFLGAAPVISRELVASVCVIPIQQLNIGLSTYTYLSSHIVVFSLLPTALSFTLLIMSSRYLTQAVANSPNAKKTSKSMLKFGLFLLLGQGFNIAGSIIAPLLTLATAVLTDGHGIPALLVNVCIFDLSLIPTPIVVTLYFTPIWKKVKIWLSRCCRHHEPTPGGREI